MVNSVVTFGILPQGGVIKSVAASKTTLVIPKGAVVVELIVNVLDVSE
jgi:hypothetical protein